MAYPKNRAKRNEIPFCTYEGCDSEYYARGWCFKHYRRWRRTGSPGGRVFGPTTYRGMHLKVVRERGKAVEHECVDCGEQASEWSYNKSDPDPKYQEISLMNRVILAEFSTNVDCYEPRCKPCHVKLDRWTNGDTELRPYSEDRQ